MSTDVNQPVLENPHPEWELPEIVNIEIRRTHFEPPKLRNFKSALSTYEEAIEFLVRTDGPIPIRALGPALFVGETQVIESQEVSDNLYRFLAFDPQQLEYGAPIAWGWINDSEDQRKATKFTYREG